MAAADAAAAAAATIANAVVPRHSYARTAHFAVVLKAVTSALSAPPIAGTESGISIPPLLELIASYLADPVTVNTWIHTPVPKLEFDHPSIALRYRPVRPDVTATASVSATGTGTSGTAAFDSDTVLVVDTGNHVIWRYSDADAVGPSFADLFPIHSGAASPSNVVVDHTRANRFFYSAKQAIGVWENGKSSVLLALPDNDANVFHAPLGLALSRDAAFVYFTDSDSDTIRDVCVATKSSRVLAASKYGGPDALVLDSDDRVRFCEPRFMCWRTRDRSYDWLAYTELYVAARESIWVFNVSTLQFVPVPLTSARYTLDPYGIVCLDSGLLIFSCFATASLWTVGPSSAGGDVKLLAGPGVPNEFPVYDTRRQKMVNGHPLTEAHFGDPAGLTVSESDYSLVIADSHANCIQKLPLPDYLFDEK